MNFPSRKAKSSLFARLLFPPIPGAVSSLPSPQERPAGSRFCFATFRFSASLQIVRALKIIVVAIIGAIAIAAGLVAAAVAAVIAVAYFAAARMLGQSRKPVDRPLPRRPTHRESADAIEVTATEVASSDQNRLPGDPHKGP